MPDPLLSTSTRSAVEMFTAESEARRGLDLLTFWGQVRHHPKAISKRVPSTPEGTHSNMHSWMAQRAGGRGTKEGKILCLEEGVEWEGEISQIWERNAGCPWKPAGSVSGLV